MARRPGQLTEKDKLKLQSQGVLPDCPDELAIATARWNLYKECKIVEVKSGKSLSREKVLESIGYLLLATQNDGGKETFNHYLFQWNVRGIFVGFHSIYMNCIFCRFCPMFSLVSGSLPCKTITVHNSYEPGTRLPNVSIEKYEGDICGIPQYIHGLHIKTILAGQTLLEWYRSVWPVRLIKYMDVYVQ